MNDKRDYDIPIRMLDPMAFDAALGHTVAPGEAGGLMREEKVLPEMTVVGLPTLVCTFDFAPQASRCDGLGMADMVIAAIRALSEAEKSLGGSGLEPRETAIRDSRQTLILTLAPTNPGGAADRLRHLSKALGPGESTGDLSARVRQACPAIARVEVAA